MELLTASEATLNERQELMLTFDVIALPSTTEGFADLYYGEDREPFCQVTQNISAHDLKTLLQFAINWDGENYESENRKKSEDYLYFTSQEYIDKIAKQNLGLVNQGEEVIVLASDVGGGGDADEQEDVGALSQKARMSNPEQWWEFFFGG